MAVLKNPRHEKFCQGIAKGLSGRQAYVKSGYSDNGADASASKLLKTPKVLQRVAELKGLVAEKVLKVTVTEKNARLEDIQDIRDRITRLILARAEEHASVKGGDSGLIVRELKTVGSGPAVLDSDGKVISGQRIVAHYTADTALLRELREYLKQAAIEMGQFSEKRELTGRDGGPIEHAIEMVDLSRLSSEELLVVKKLVDSAAEIQTPA